MKRDHIIFDETSHRYFYAGKELTGVTRSIGARLGKKFPESLSVAPVLESATDDGKFIHAEMEDYLNRALPPENPATAWIVQEIEKRYHKEKYRKFSEFLVSDYKSIATAIDIVILDAERNAVIMDIKTGKFDREYCSWQLGVNKRLLEIEGDIRVVGAFVISTKARYFYRIEPKSADRVDDLFNLAITAESCV